MLRVLDDAGSQVPRGKIPSSWESSHRRRGQTELAIIEHESHAVDEISERAPHWCEIHDAIID